MLQFLQGRTETLVSGIRHSSRNVALLLCLRLGEGHLSEKQVLHLDRDLAWGGPGN